MLNYVSAAKSICIIIYFLQTINMKISKLSCIMINITEIVINQLDLFWIYM